MSKWDPNKKFTALEDVVFTDLDDGSAVLLHLQTKYYYSLNDTGCFLWKLLESGKGASEEELVAELYHQFDVEREMARKDVQDFLKDLQDQGLIK